MHGFFFIWLFRFFLLMFGHALGDFVFQNDGMAQRKSWHFTFPGVPWYYWMAAHCLVHGGLVTMFTGSIVLGVLETVIHFMADCLKCAGKTNIHQDQAIHTVCKAVWAAL